ncbi:MAG: helix-turn-helix domain-containing protein [Chitinophagaceae bacterium]|nr:helix-turn-helix domain-containing protein [Chitinophagaceae bacterium]
MATQFGDRIRELRTKQKLLLRQVASKLDVDTSIISKMERGERPIKKEQITILAEILKADKDELITLWLADQLYDVLKDEKLANEAMKLAEQKINYKKHK